MISILKYPRTPHLEGSRLQPGDEDLNQIAFSSIKGKHLVVEEKIDGANSAVSFDTDGTLLLQSRGHYLTGGYRERHYDLLKTWASVHRDAFYAVLGARYVMYGEWMYAKHNIFYDSLPHYFLEFDVFDRERKVFLDTPSREKLTRALPIISVPVLAEGEFTSRERLLSLIGRSSYISGRHREALKEACSRLGLDAEMAISGDSDGTMEGLYIKIEENGVVVDRLKYVRASFSQQQIVESSTPWIDRPIVPNGLARSLDDLFLPKL